MADVNVNTVSSVYYKCSYKLNGSRLKYDDVKIHLEITELIERFLHIRDSKHFNGFLYFSIF